MLEAIEKGFVNVEYWGQNTSANIFLRAERLTLQTGGKVSPRTGYDAPDAREGEDESSFTFDIEATPEQFRGFCDGMRALGIRVKYAQLGTPEEEERDFD